MTKGKHKRKQVAKVQTQTTATPVAPTPKAHASLGYAAKPSEGTSGNSIPSKGTDHVCWLLLLAVPFLIIWILILLFKAG